VTRLQDRLLDRLLDQLVQVVGRPEAAAERVEPCELPGVSGWVSPPAGQTNVCFAKLADVAGISENQVFKIIRARREGKR
jgi:hypothetical protein